VASGTDVVIDAFVILCDTWPQRRGAACSDSRPQHQP
jgi:hypothetical protein